LENIVGYDYPTVSGKGEYRQARVCSESSLSSKVEGAFEGLIKAAASMPADLILSYPADGLMRESKQKISAMLAKYFRDIREPETIAHEHSTMGASKGTQKHNVTEHIFVAQNGR
jgi:adenine-specific DNA-methyltransferase